MSSSELDRVRADLAVMQQALGFGNRWARADVWLGLGLAAACEVFALMRWPGLPIRVPEIWSAVLILGYGAAYLAFMALKSRTLPTREEPRKREYRATVIVAVGILLATGAAVYWSRAAGMTGAQLGGCFFFAGGAATLVVLIAGVAPPEYPKAYILAGGLPILILGILMPLVPREYVMSVVGLIGGLGVAASSVAMWAEIRRREADEAANVLRG